MTRTEFHELLLNYKIPDRWYSLDDGLKPDACILYKNNSKWEFFYLDEKGERHDYKIFGDEYDALDYLWKKLKRQSEIFGKSNNNS